MAGVHLPLTRRSAHRRTPAQPADRPELSHGVPRRTARAIAHACAAAGVAAVLAILSLCGWALGRPSLAALVPNGPTLKPNTALGLLFAALSLLLRALGSHGSRLRSQDMVRAARAFALVPLLAGALTLLQYAFALDFGIDERLFLDRWTRPEQYPGRPTVVSAVALVLSSVPLLADGRARRGVAVHVSVLVVAGFSWLCLVACLFRIGAPADQPGTRILSAPAALGFLGLSYGLLWLRPDSGLMRVLLSDTLAGLTARRLIFVGALLPAMLGWIYLQGTRGHWFGPEVGLALFMTTTVTGYIFLVWLNARGAMQVERVRANANARVEQALQRTGTALATANAYLQAAPGAMLITTGAGDVEVTNPQAELLFGYVREDLVGRNIDELLAPASGPFSSELTQTCAASPSHRQTLRRTLRALRKDGVEPDVEVSLSPVQTEEGPRAIVAFHDVSAYRAAQRATQRLTDRLQLATRAAGIGIWDWDLAADTLAWEPLMYELYGLRGGSFSGRFADWRKMLLPDDLPAIEREVREAMAARRDLHTEFRIRRPDGSVRVLQGRALVQRDASGKAVRMLGADRDITAQREADARVRASEHRFRAIFDSAFQFIGLLEPDGTVIEANQTALDFGGLTPADVLGKPFWEAHWWSLSEATQEQLREAISRAAAGEVIRYRVAVCGAGERVATIDFSLKPIRDEAGKVVMLLPEGRDITEAERARAALAESEARFRNAMEYAAIGMALVGLDGHFLLVNRALCEIVGYSDVELNKLTFQEITYPEDLDTDVGFVKKLLAGEISHYHMEKRYVHKQGHLVWVLLSGALVRSPSGEPRMFVAEVQDITEQKAYEARLKQSVLEKEVLLKEIHHRVKNNLQVISSILRLQAEQSGAIPELRAMFQDSQARIQTMALVHDRLYQSGSLASIDFGAHLRDLATMLVRFFGGPHRRIRLAFDVEPVTLNLDTAIPLGLIANELITNALKHAFKDRVEGTISISLAQQNTVLTLQVADDGVGFPLDFDFEVGKKQSLGMRLIRALTRQLHGQITLEGKSAVSVVAPLGE